MKEKDIWMLQEREKELECMYAVDEVLQNNSLSLSSAMNQIIHILPTGFSDPKSCRANIVLYGAQYSADDFHRSVLLHQTAIVMDSHSVGHLAVGYMVTDKEKAPKLLDSEVKIMEAVSARIAQLALQAQRELSMVLDMLQKVDPGLLMHICQQLRLYLDSHKNKQVQENTASTKKTSTLNEQESMNAKQTLPTYGEVNTPLPKQSIPNVWAYGRHLIFEVTAILSVSQVYALVNRWIQDARLFSLVKAVGNKDAQVSEILDAVRNYTAQITAVYTDPFPSHVQNTSTAVKSAVAPQGRNNAKNITIPHESPQSSPTETWLIVELCHRFLTNDEKLISYVLDNLSIADFAPLLERIVGSAKSKGNIGGKGAGLFIAEQILKQAAKTDPLLAHIKTPRSWYIAADQISDFLRYNNMEEMNAYKYNPISYVRMTYDYVVTKIKNGRLPSHILQMLNFILDDLNGIPIIVRSSSLLEDRSQGAFSGKYKSLFLVNTGTKQERFEALADAILEVYSSQYNPDSFQYRKRRKLLSFTEQMGILIQEVVGQKVGPYYLPLFAGVAFSENPHCWSKRITREGGLVRMVMGLGTRAVDRVSDYPLLFSPSQPGFRINQSPEEIKTYAQKYIDVLNIEEGCFETVHASSFLKEWGSEVPGLHKLVSVYQDGYMQSKNAMELSPKKDDMVITFEGILSDSQIPKKIAHILSILKKKMHTEVDIEFAYNGRSFILLQCRALSGGLTEAAAIPNNLTDKDILFTANRFIQNGRIEQVRYIVYVDPNAYSRMEKLEDLLAVGKAVGLLNDRFSRGKYILMGPGRWGSRGDIQLGVRVTYADICNTAVLIEIARKKHAYVPELSFGTHFFQDLVEAGIAYLPLYPDEGDSVFKEDYFIKSANLLADLLPQYAHLSNVVHVLDLAKAGKRLCLLMNAQKQQAVAFLKAEENTEKEIAAGNF